MVPNWRLITGMIFTTKKSRLRKNILNLRSKLSPEERIQQTAAITKNFLALPEYQKGKTIGFYASKVEEVSTDHLIRKAFADGKRVVLPRVEGSRLVWHEIKSLKQIDFGSFAVREPAKRALEVEVRQLDLLVVPGVVFDKRGDRLGYGKGFYDRILQNYKGKTVGLAFACQMVDRVPAEKHDRRVDKVLVGEEG